MNPAEYPLSRFGEVDLATVNRLVDWEHPSELEKIMFSVAEPDFDKLLLEVVPYPSLAKVSWSGGTTLLGVAAGAGRSDLVQFLIAQGADVNVYEELVGLPIHSAVQCGSMECVKQLIAAGSRLDTPDRHGETPLHSAAIYGDPEIVKVLLDSGARINAHGFDHLTPLESAVNWKQYQAVKVLVQYGATTADEKCNEYIKEAMIYEP